MRTDFSCTVAGPVQGFKNFSRPIDPSNPADRAAHDEPVRPVDRMLDLHRRRAPLPESGERERITREIESVDRQIDEIVYGLSGITEEERKIIEGQK